MESRLLLRVALGVLALVSQGANAHDTFLLPAEWDITPGQPVALELSSGSAFPALGSGPTPNRVVALGGQAVAPDGRSPVSMRIAGHTEQALTLQLSAAGPGVVVAGLSLAARDIDLEPKSVAHYFDEIRPSQAVRDAWAESGADVLRESYAKHAKVVLCATACGPNDASPTALGHALEFLPLAQRDRGMQRFRLLIEGAPAAHHPLNHWSANGDHVALRTDADGVVEIRFVTPGPAMLSAVNLRPPAGEGERFQSDFATLTLLVPAIRGRAP
ncbi:MAG: DUF4198 domain-containing protein [Pseudomonadota bacterium]